MFACPQEASFVAVAVSLAAVPAQLLLARATTRAWEALNDSKVRRLVGGDA